jgi:hypothetical protein
MRRWQYPVRDRCRGDLLCEYPVSRERTTYDGKVDEGLNFPPIHMTCLDLVGTDLGNLMSTADFIGSSFVDSCGCVSTKVMCPK